MGLLFEKKLEKPKKLENGNLKYAFDVQCEFSAAGEPDFETF